MARQAPARLDEGLLISQAYEAALVVAGHDAPCCYHNIMLPYISASCGCPDVLWIRPPFFEAPMKRDQNAHALQWTSKMHSSTFSCNKLLQKKRSRQSNGMLPCHERTPGA